MERAVFIKRLVRFVLLLFISTLAVVLGSRASAESNCNTCPGKGICSGESDCLSYLNTTGNE
jgi:hypothetical protein